MLSFLDSLTIKNYWCHKYGVNRQVLDLPGRERELLANIEPIEEEIMGAPNLCTEYEVRSIQPYGRLLGLWSVK